MPPDDEGVSSFRVTGPAAGSTSAASAGAEALKAVKGPGFLSELVFSMPDLASAAVNSGKVRVEFQISQATTFNTGPARFRHASYLGQGESAVLHPNFYLQRGEQLNVVARIRARDNSISAAVRAEVDVSVRVSMKPVAGAEQFDSEGWYYRAVTTTDPAPGSDAQRVQPDFLESQYFGGQVTAVTDATAANRVMQIVFVKESLSFTYTTKSVQQATQTRRYEMGPHVALAIETLLELEVKINFEPITLLPGDSVETNLINGVAGDNQSALVLFCRERIVPLSAS